MRLETNTQNKAKPGTTGSASAAWTAAAESTISRSFGLIAASAKKGVIPLSELKKFLSYIDTATATGNEHGAARWYLSMGNLLLSARLSPQTFRAAAQMLIGKSSAIIDPSFEAELADLHFRLVAKMSKPLSLARRQGAGPRRGARDLLHPRQRPLKLAHRASWPARRASTWRRRRRCTLSSMRGEGRTLRARPMSDEPALAPRSPSRACGAPGVTRGGSAATEPGTE